MDWEVPESKVFSGEDAFKLHDEVGYTIEILMEDLSDRGMIIDAPGFLACVKERGWNLEKWNAKWNFYCDTIGYMTEEWMNRWFGSKEV